MHDSNLHHIPFATQPLNKFEQIRKVVLCISPKVVFHGIIDMTCAIHSIAQKQNVHSIGPPLNPSKKDSRKRPPSIGTVFDGWAKFRAFLFQQKKMMQFLSCLVFLQEKRLATLQDHQNTRAVQGIAVHQMRSHIFSLQSL